MKTVGTIIKCRLVNRNDINKTGVTLVFDTELGEIIRTFNIPSYTSTKCDLFKLLKDKLEVNPPVAILNKPLMFCLALESKLRGIKCEITIIPSGNDKYPYNIVKIEPILTVSCSYITQKALD